MTAAEALLAIPLWAAACIFIAVVVARIVRDLTAPHDPENPYDL